MGGIRTRKAETCAPRVVPSAHRVLSQVRTTPLPTANTNGALKTAICRATIGIGRDTYKKNVVMYMCCTKL